MIRTSPYLEVNLVCILLISEDKVKPSPSIMVAMEQRLGKVCFIHDILYRISTVRTRITEAAVFHSDHCRQALLCGVISTGT